jgi:hypothetical protein
VTARLPSSRLPSVRRTALQSEKAAESPAGFTFVAGAAGASILALLWYEHVQETRESLMWKNMVEMLER